MSKTKIERLVVKSALRVIPLDGLQVDPSYQREVKDGHKKIMANFNEEALGIPLIGEREDAGLWIVDGLQRITALRKLGKTSVRAEVFASKGPEHEAQVFKDVNMNRTKLTPGDQFKALLTAGDILAWSIKEVVERCGFKLSLQRGRGGSATCSLEVQAKYVSSINTLVRVAKRQSVEAIEFALKTADACWPADLMGTYHFIIEGLAIFHHRNDGSVDLDRLYPRLRTVTPNKVLYAAGQATLVGGKGPAVADQIEKVYRKRCVRPR